MGRSIGNDVFSVRSRKEHWPLLVLGFVSVCSGFWNAKNQTQMLSMYSGLWTVLLTFCQTHNRCKRIQIDATELEISHARYSSWAYPGAYITHNATWPAALASVLWWDQLTYPGAEMSCWMTWINISFVFMTFGSTQTRLMWLDIYVFLDIEKSHFRISMIGRISAFFPLEYCVCVCVRTCECVCLTHLSPPHHICISPRWEATLPLVRVNLSYQLLIISNHTLT